MLGWGRKARSLSWVLCPVGSGTRFALLVSFFRWDELGAAPPGSLQVYTKWRRGDTGELLERECVLSLASQAERWRGERYAPCLGLLGIRGGAGTRIVRTAAAADRALEILISNFPTAPY